MKLTHDDIIEAKEVYIQLSFERYKVKFMLHNYSLSVYILLDRKEDSIFKRGFIKLGELFGLSKFLAASKCNAVL